MIEAHREMYGLLMDALDAGKCRDSLEFRIGKEDVGLFAVDIASNPYYGVTIAEAAEALHAGQFYFLGVQVKVNESGE